MWRPPKDNCTPFYGHVEDRKEYFTNLQCRTLMVPMSTLFNKEIYYKCGLVQIDGRNLLSVSCVQGETAVFIQLLKSFVEGQWDGSSGNGACWESWGPEFDPQNSQDRSREPTPRKLSSDLHMHFICPFPQIIIA